MSARKKTMNKTNALTSNPPFLKWIGTIAIALFLIIFPYDRGLFNGYELGFDSALYGAMIYGFILLLLTAAFISRSWQLNSYRSILSIGVLILPLLYWLSSFQAVSKYYAVFMALILFLLSALFISGMYFAESKLNRKVIEYALMLTSYSIVLFGLLNLFGQMYYRDALWLAHDGYRLAAVFQYSNTYAGFLAALFLVSIYYAVHCIRPSARIIHAAMLVPIWISFMLTYSRGAVVIIPIMVLILIPFLRLTKQINYLLFLVLSVVVSMSILGKLTTITEAISKLVQPNEEKAQTPISLFSSLPLQSWGLLLLGMAITTGLIMLYHYKVNVHVEAKMNKLAARKWSFAAVPGAIIVFTGAAIGALTSSSAVRGLLPDKIAVRFENINFQQHSVLERLTFYKDGLRVAEDYPLLGGGGGAWQAMFEQYQNNPYWSRQAHSYFVQVLVESGWIGLIALVGLIGFVYYLYIRSFIRFPELRGSHFIFFIMSLTLLMHSALDFDMSFIFISAIVFVSLGCMLAPYSSKLMIESLTNKTKKSWQKIIYPAAIGLLSIVLLVTAIRENTAIQKYNKAFSLAVQQQTSLSELLILINKAIAISPKHTDFSLTKANWLEQGYRQIDEFDMLDEALATLKLAQKYDPYNRIIIMTNYRLLQEKGQLEQSIAMLEEGLSKFPWDINIYEAVITSYVTASKNALAANDTAAASQYKERVDQLSSEIQRRMDQLASLPPEQQQGRAFAFTEAINEAISQLEIASTQ
ncbi:tetratricopeptide (TPR) repeat protein [Paenibacillus castaneae]|uniref:O-antigen ligase family protein n=1 Tax=Paenibacillus castaneae TaxID=474957 RepID=UPI000C9CE531|nr:O-antigen ligase family protein [Paenibacillus castaneae]NIK78349.1 tetratricopeptide (TPR) repeat protein [Paenibacillus castaneae]